MMQLDISSEIVALVSSYSVAYSVAKKVKLYLHMLRGFFQLPYFVKHIHFVTENCTLKVIYRILNFLNKEVPSFYTLYLI